jgi:hypothetical protein
MTKKTILILIALASILILGTIAFDMLLAPKHQILQSSINEPLASAVAIDMDLEENDIPQETYVLNGKDPLLVIVTVNANTKELQTIRVFRNLAELTALDSIGDQTITQMDPAYKTLGLVYLPTPRFFSSESDKIRIVLISHAGINGILFNKQWIEQEQIAHPNFKIATAYALMADNTKRPVVPVQMPANILADIQNPEKVLLIQQKISR